MGKSVALTSTGNQTRVAYMVAQWFTQYATAALNGAKLELNDWFFYFCVW